MGLCLGKVTREEFFRVSIDGSALISKNKHASRGLQISQVHIHSNLGHERFLIIRLKIFLSRRYNLLTEDA